MAITLSGDGISSDAIASLAASKLTGQVPDANAPSGSVIQVVSTTLSSAFTAGNGDIEVTGLSASITPRSTTSKILVFASVGMAASAASGTGWYVTRNGSKVGVGDAAGSRVRTTSGGAYNGDDDTASESSGQSRQFLDSPNSTDALTYKIFAYSYPPGGGSIWINRPQNNDDNTDRTRSISSITLMEISA
jgi:hypothetical protein